MRTEDGNDLTGHNDLVGRLHGLGQEPVDGTVMAEHLAAMSRTRPPRSWRRRAALAIAGVTVLGGGSLAWAGDLPDAAQDAAHTALGPLGVPPGHDRVEGVEACGDETVYANHGAYVKAHHGDNPDAAKSDCGKPKKAVEHPDGDEGPDTETSDEGGDHGKHLGQTKGHHEDESVTTPSPSDHPGEGDGHPPAVVPPAEPGEGTPPSEPGETEHEDSPPDSVPVGTTTTTAG